MLLYDIVCSILYVDLYSFSILLTIYKCHPIIWLWSPEILNDPILKFRNTEIYSQNKLTFFSFYVHPNARTELINIRKLFCQNTIDREHFHSRSE